MIADDSLPDDVETLKRLVRAGEADLARARAEASSAAALIAHLRLTIEKMRREIYDPRSESKIGARRGDVIKDARLQNPSSFGNKRSLMTAHAREEPRHAQRYPFP